MFKIARAAVMTVAAAGGCSQIHDQPAPTPAPTPCVVWAEVDDVPNVDPPCQLNLIYPTHDAAKADCADAGGRLGQLLDVCYNVDY